MTSQQQAAEEHLHAIRLLMERSTIYRAISAPTALVGGILSVSVAAAMLAWQWGDYGRNIEARLFFVIWLLVFLLTLGANTFFILRGARSRQEPLVSAGFRLAVHSLTPAFFAGIALSGVLLMTSELPLVPTLMWVICYGLGLLATMNFAPRSLLVLGWAFLFTGAAAFIYLMNQSIEPQYDLPTPTRFYPAAIMGGTFGLYHLVYAACVWPRRARVLDNIERRPLVVENHPPLA